MKSSAAIREVPAAEPASEANAPVPFEAKARQENPQAPKPEAEAVSAPSPKPSRKFPVRKAIFGMILVAALAGAAWYGHEWYTVGRFVVSTDDAYVKGDTSALGAKVAGYVAAIPVADNSAVKAGDVLLTLDDGDYKLAMDFGQGEDRLTEGHDRRDHPPDRRAAGAD
ncbi:biotin/lipoyl-binding protein [Aestuariivirga sp.]|uniref:biotin/lipoyl-binding protein n=1 Tax=Aestuariivirga sp. TaxID=2650926 RepID=UPI0039E3DFFD